jgi:hypothetical protein
MFGKVMSAMPVESCTENEARGKSEVISICLRSAVLFVGDSWLRTVLVVAVAASAPTVLLVLM